MLLKCTNIKKYFPIKRGYFRVESAVLKAVDGVSIEIESGQTFGLVGGSGSGKTTLAKIILGALKPDSGDLALNTKNIQAIFQDPYNSLDPKMNVGQILSEGLVLKKEDKAVIKKKVLEALDLVRLPQDSSKKYPRQFSGGERQRIAIARAIITEPEFIVCDEPVSNLDITIQLGILKLLKDIQKRFSITYLFISHDLKVIKYMCDKVAVMMEGKIVESGGVNDVYTSPKHEYTKNLLASHFSLVEGWG